MRSIYDKLSLRIEEEIRLGHFPGRRLPGVHTLARRLGANHITIRKALELLEEKGVLEVIPSRGTFLCRIAERRTRHRIIGCVGSYFSQEIQSAAMERAEEELKKEGYSLLNITAVPSIFDENPRLLLQFPVDGYIFFGSSITKRICDCLMENHIPVICSNNPKFPVDHVGSDHLAAYTKALSALKAAGCRRIGFLDYQRPPDFVNYIEDIRRVFQRELEDAFDPGLFCLYNAQRLYLLHDEGYHEAAAQEYLRTHRENMPDGIVAVYQSIPVLKRYHPDLKAAVVTDHLPCPGCDFVLYQELRPLLEAALKRMLEILAGDTSVTETILPMDFYSRENVPIPATGREDFI